ncbi:MAG: hypothetical protein RBT15_04665 [Gudongella sp.]|jgi:hypothetical protein|nr:hypothetical protein [Gudongella sp.]
MDDKFKKEYMSVWHINSPRLPSPHLQELPQYHFTRYEFCSVIRENYPDFEEDFFDCMPDKHTESFSLFNVYDERYILHRESGTMINWYKNLGRTNTCNKPLDLKGLEEFILLLKSELKIELQRSRRGQRVKAQPVDDACNVDFSTFSRRIEMDDKIQLTEEENRILVDICINTYLGYNTIYCHLASNLVLIKYVAVSDEKKAILLILLNRIPCLDFDGI